MLRFISPPTEKWPLPLTCGGLAWNISNVECLPYSVRFVTASALWAPLVTVSEKSCQRAWIDCNALMDLYDIYEPDVRRHPSCGSGCRITPQDTWYDDNDISKSPVFLFLSDFSLWNHCRIGFYCPGWWTVLYIFKTNLLFCPCREAVLNEEMCFFHVLYFESLHGSWNSDFGKIQSIYSKKNNTNNILWPSKDIFFWVWNIFF